MLPRLPYRIQIPLGLSLAVTLSVLLVSAVAANISAVSARQGVVTTAQRVMDLLAAQGRPLLMADDTWRAYELLRNAAALMPDAESGHSRAAILDAQGHCLAGSDPTRLPTGIRVLGARRGPFELPAASATTAPRAMEAANHDLALLQPIRSEDSQVVGFVFAEVDAAAFAPDWATLATPALVGAALAVIVLLPLGWLAGRRMARPVAQIAQCIAQIGKIDLAQVQAQVPEVSDPELNRISGAVRRLVAEMAVRQENEQRALSAERLAAVGRITAAVAHEINNPLAGLLTAVRTLRLHGEAADTRERTVGLIERGLNQIRTMTTALLPQARVEDRALSVSDLEDVLTLVQVSATMLSVAVELTTRIEAELRVPSSTFRQVMLNLLLNAIKAAGDGGHVHATLTCTPERLLMIVENTGQAMSSQDLQLKLRAEDRHDPHGFGLWICREIAVRCGGRFDASDAADVPAPFSTSLIFWLPNQSQHEFKRPTADRG
jgi:signal transduction histidine kinase